MWPVRRPGAWPRRSSDPGSELVTPSATYDTSCHQFGFEAAGRYSTRCGKIEDMVVGPDTDDTGGAGILNPGPLGRHDPFGDAAWRARR